jgi:hypothetical protein
MQFRTNGLIDMITGSGRVNLLLGQIRVNGSDLALQRGARPQIRWATVLAGWAAQATRARGGRMGRAEVSAQKSNSNKKFLFFFKSIL